MAQGPSKRMPERSLWVAISSLPGSPNDAEMPAATASAPEVLDTAARARDEAAVERDIAATGRENAAAARDARGVPATELERLAVERLLAARDRAAAALDRQEAALDRVRATQYLQRTYRDSLTGVLQRVSGRDQLSRAVDRSNRGGDPLTVAFLDVDRLKEVNDTQGHAAGDALLCAVAGALTGALRSYDLVVRYGGDEFVCAFPDTALLDASARFDDVALAVERAVPGASFSVGLAQLEPDETLDSLIGRADREMYSSRRGRSGHTPAPS